MTEDNLRVGGAVVLWTLSEWTDLAKLRDGLTMLGYGDCAPERRPASAALKSALEETLGTKHHLVRPLKDREGFTVVREDRGDDRNQYQHVLSAKLLFRDDKSVDRIEFSPWTAESGRITDAFNKHLGLLPAAAVGDALVKLVGKLNGTAIRPRGGVYWIANRYLRTWKEAADVVELCAAGKNHRLYTMRQLMDPDAARAIRDAIEAELLLEARTIHEEIMSGELGERALLTRQAKVLELTEKAREYERILGESLAHLAEALDKSLTAGAASALLVAAGAGGQSDG